MAALIKPQELKVITKDGECQISITLNLNINLNSDGSISATVDKKEEEKSGYVIPDFKAKDKINFGQIKRD